jgi:hypothetical protein
MHGGGDRGEEPAEEIGREAAAGDDFMFADDTFPSLPDFPCLSSPSSSTYSSSSTNSSSAYTNVASGGTGGGADGAAGEPASAGEGFGALEDIDQILDFASLSVPSWDSEPLFPDVGMMIEDAMSEPPHPVGDVPAGRGQGKAVLEGAGGEEGEACMDAPPAAAAGEDLSRFFMEWLKSNRESISAEDLRRIRLRRSTVDAAAARLGGGRQGTMQLLKLILTWVKNNHLQKKSPHGAMEERSHGHGGQLPSPGAVNADGYEFPAAGGQDMGGTSWAAMPYQQSPAYGGENTVSYPSGQQQYTFHHHRSCGTSSVVVNSQPFSPPAAGDMHAASGGNISWPRQYMQFPAAGESTGAASYPMPRVVPQAFASGFAGQYAMGGGGGGGHQRMLGVEASATKEARKKRMAKQRRLSCLQQQKRSQQLSLGQIQGAVLQQAEPSPRAAHSAPVTPSSGGPWGFWPSSSGQQIRNPLCKSNSSTPMLQVPSPEAPPPAARRAPSARQEESSQRAAASDKRQVPACTSLSSNRSENAHHCPETEHARAHESVRFAYGLISVPPEFLHSHQSDEHVCCFACRAAGRRTRTCGSCCRRC